MPAQQWAATRRSGFWKQTCYSEFSTLYCVGPEEERLKKAAICCVAGLTVFLASCASKAAAPRPRTVDAPAPAWTPDALRLSDPADRAAFTGWFTFLAELQFFREARELPAEVADCAGLVRFAYRESLRKHTGEWATALHLPAVPALGTVRQSQYPHTPLGAALFRVHAGGDTAAAFAEFADAKTLMRLNTERLHRRIEAAAPGDLLFFHAPDQRFPYHVMVFLGASRVQNDTGPFVVYHTGPDRESAGEVRHPSVDELLRHPNPQ